MLVLENVAGNVVEVKFEDPEDLSRVRVPVKS